MPCIGRFVCYFLHTSLLINVISGQQLNRVGAPGIPGDLGAKGEKGERGEKGDVGPLGRRTSGDGINMEDEGKGVLGSETNPATSCLDEKLNTTSIKESEPIYVYPAQPFPVICTSLNAAEDFPGKNTEDFKACLHKTDTKVVKGFEFPGKPFWLSTKGFELLQLYNDFGIRHVSQLKFLLKMSYKVSLEIVVYCKNTEISRDTEKYLQIHLWDGRNVGPFPSSLSPAYYEIPDALNKCKDFTDETKWGTATITLNASPTFIKDFYIRDIKEGKKQEIDVELKEFCIYY